MKKLTVFTPTFNRAHLLPRLYESLKKQTCQDFLWLVIDDGSSDDTKTLLHSYISEAFLEIKYLYQDNQGMHGAHNTAYRNIKTELNTCIDSDDFMPENAVELILREWNSISDKEKFAGLIGLDAYIDSGKIVGTTLPDHEINFLEYYNSGGSGDKKLVYRTDVIQSVPEYPVFEGEKYVGLSYKYMLVEKKLVTINQVLVIVDYQPTGSSNNMFRQYFNNPKGFAFLRLEQMKLPMPLKRKVMDAIHYVSSSLLSRDQKFLRKSPQKLLTFFAIPAGIVLYALVRFKNRNRTFSREL